ncbi:ecdysteroid kinase family protein, partial [Vibrio parahaemolyticus V-223/04]
LKNVPVGE